MDVQRIGLKMNRQTPNEVETEDKLSGLNDCVLLHIMSFWKTKQAVQTCVLSKRWEHLWKSLSNLKLDSSHFPTLVHFSEFLSSILSHRDGSISLENVACRHPGYIPTETLNSFIEYVVSHGIQHLTLDTKFQELPPCIFSCRSLTSLTIYNPSTQHKKTLLLPESLEFPTLKSLYLEDINFRTSGNDYPEPFSTCNMLNTLVIKNCFEDGLYICNSMLTSLTIDSSNSYGAGAHNYNVVLCTPRLSSLNTNGYLVYEISSKCSLPYLEEVNFDVTCTFRDFPRKSIVLISWLKVLANVTTMTLSSYTIEMLNVLLFRRSARTNLPCFSRLKSLKVKLGPFSKMSSDQDVCRIVGYLLQNSPSTRVDIIRHAR